MSVVTGKVVGKDNEGKAYMQGLLHGLQYKYNTVSTARDEMVSFLGGITPEERWTDVAMETKFKAKVLLRLAPIVEYEAVRTNTPNEKVTGTKDVVMSYVARELEDGHQINVRSYDKAPEQTVPEFLTSRNIQWRYQVGQGWSNWVDEPYHSMTVPIQFRLTPDYTYALYSRSDSTNVNLSFDDTEELVAHITRLITTDSTNSLQITKVKR